MTRFRFSLVGLMAAVFIAAVGFAALRNATEVWAHTAFTLALGIFFFAILAVFFGQGGVRRFWCGFAVFGWSICTAVFMFRLRVDGHRCADTPLQHCRAWKASNNSAGSQQIDSNPMGTVTKPS